MDSEEVLDEKHLSEQLSSLGVLHMLTWVPKEKSETVDVDPIVMLIVVHTSDPQSIIYRKNQVRAFAFFFVLVAVWVSYRLCQ